MQTASNWTAVFLLMKNPQFPLSHSVAHLLLSSHQDPDTPPVSSLFADAWNGLLFKYKQITGIIRRNKEEMRAEQAGCITGNAKEKRVSGLDKDRTRGMTEKLGGRVEMASTRSALVGNEQDNRGSGSAVNVNGRIEEGPGDGVDGNGRNEEGNIDLGSDLAVIIDKVNVEYKLLSNLEDFNWDEGYRQDPAFRSAYGKALDNASLTPIDGYLLKSNRLLYNTTNGYKICILILLLQEVVYIAHNVMGHMGYKKTYARITEQFYCPKLAQYVEEYVGKCPKCIINKTASSKTPGNMLPINNSSGPS